MTREANFLKVEHELSGFTIEKLSRMMKLSFSRKLLANENINITVDQWVCLKLLDQYGQMNQQQLSDHSLKDAPTLTRIIDKLEAKALIAKAPDPNDRRKTNLSLTDEGETMVARIKPILQSFRSEVYSGISASELHTMEEIIHKIFSNLNYLNQ
ncbi:MAG: MarR family transcriptional regulator [Saprospiraceae bacterium]|nr:MarR family transcriptional regulator [Saprospiraceae bacterium]MCB9309949.1 MarR family transcriptional regulator [Lewinellaceae bacterium]